MAITINIVTKNITLDEPLRVFVNQKIGALGRYVKGGGAIQANVEIGKPSRHHRTGPVFRAEANIAVGKRLLRAEAMHIDLRAAIVQVKDELKAQITKLKGKRSLVTRKTSE